MCIRKSHAFDFGKVGKFTIVACWVMPKGVMLELRGRLKIMNSPFGLRPYELLTRSPFGLEE